MKEIIEKINQDIFERSMKNNFAELPKMGYAAHEFDYKKCKSTLKELKDYFFVVSKKLEYKNGGMVGYKRKVYTYDKDGNFVDDESVYKNNKEGFYKSLEEISA